MNLHMNMGIHIYKYVYRCIHIYTDVYLSIYIYICIIIDLSLCMHVCIYIYIYIFGNKLNDSSSVIIIEIEITEIYRCTGRRFEAMCKVWALPTIVKHHRIRVACNNSRCGKSCGKTHSINSRKSKAQPANMQCHRKEIIAIAVTHTSKSHNVTGMIKEHVFQTSAKRIQGASTAQTAHRMCEKHQHCHMRPHILQSCVDESASPFQSELSVLCLSTINHCDRTMASRNMFLSKLRAPVEINAPPCRKPLCCADSRVGVLSARLIRSCALRSTMLFVAISCMRWEFRVMPINSPVGSSMDWFESGNIHGVLPNTASYTTMHCQPTRSQRAMMRKEPYHHWRQFSCPRLWSEKLIDSTDPSRVHLVARKKRMLPRSSRCSLDASSVQECRRLLTCKAKTHHQRSTRSSDQRWKSNSDRLLWQGRLQSYLQLLPLPAIKWHGQTNARWWNHAKISSLPQLWHCAWLTTCKRQQHEERAASIHDTADKNHIMSDMRSRTLRGTAAAHSILTMELGIAW